MKDKVMKIQEVSITFVYRKHGISKTDSDFKFEKIQFELVILKDIQP